MTDLDIFDASPFDAIRRTDEAGEYWSARGLMPLLGYGADWRNFEAAIGRALASATSGGSDVGSVKELLALPRVLEQLTEDGAS